MAYRIAARMMATSLVVGLVGCAPEPPPPRTTADFMDDPIALDGALVRCNADRQRTLRDPECQNAREAAHRISVAEEEERLRALEEQSQRKREELRRLQEAADEARRLAEEAEREAEEARLLRQLIEAGDDPVIDSTGEAVIEPQSPVPAEQQGEAQSETD